MPVFHPVIPKEIFMGKLKHGADLLEELTEVCRRQNACLGRIEALGAVQKARIGYYNQKKYEYQSIELDSPHEITSLIGNVSLKDGNPIVHAHITLAAENGTVYGGHLMPGTIIFACEFMLQAFEGPAFERVFDEETGLPLWKMEQKTRFA